VMFVSSFWLIHIFLLVANLGLVCFFFWLVFAYQPWISSFLLFDQFLFVAPLNVRLLLLIRSCLLPPLMFVSPFDRFLFVGPSDVCSFLLINWLLPFTQASLYMVQVTFYVVISSFWWIIKCCQPWWCLSFIPFDQFLFLGPWWSSFPPLILLI
jgi:hypothetical protein